MIILINLAVCSACVHLVPLTPMPYLISLCSSLFSAHLNYPIDESTDRHLYLVLASSYSLSFYPDRTSQLIMGKQFHNALGKLIQLRLGLGLAGEQLIAIFMLDSKRYGSRQSGNDCHLLCRRQPCLIKLTMMVMHYEIGCNGIGMVISELAREGIM